MKILNLYSGIGGNRQLWKDVEVTSVEINPQIANIYSDFYPNDNIIIGDAHLYLLENYYKYDFIWSSPPCQSHSSFRQNICVRYRNTKPEYPDMKLYQEIIFLQYNSKCKWVVENVKPYYEPLIHGKLIQRHLFWSNFGIENINIKNDDIRTAQIPQLQKQLNINLDKYKLPNKRQILRNCVEPKLGLHILNQAKGIKLDTEQQDLF
tara:strand:- start:393 stop:1013 length:621 start_codon:yes stop_codon:yes gene_type:complete